MSTYEAELYWTGPANEVSLTGSFDNWSQSVHMEKTSTGFAGKVKLPYGQKVDYKYVVDGQWQVNPDFPTTYDWQGNINNYIVTPNEPEPVAEAPKSLPTPPPELVIKAPSTPANDEPVTPIALPAPAAAVTPMEVPQSAVAPYPDLDVDPIVGRSIVESIVAATKVQETPKEEKTEEIAAPVAEESKAEVHEPVEPKVEVPEVTEPKVEVQEVTEPKVEAPAPIETKTEELAHPHVLSAQELVVSPAQIPDIPDEHPNSDDVKPEAVALDSPAKPAASPLPEIAVEAAPAAVPSTPAAVPLPETPAATPAVEKQAEPTTSQFSTTTDGTKPEVPVTPTKKSEDRPGTVKRGSTRSSKMFSFSGRRVSQDSSSELGVNKSPKSPGTPGSERKKKNSFMTKVHDLFHPHPKE